jgi:hypothetical protein
MSAHSPDEPSAIFKVRRSHFGALVEKAQLLNASYYSAYVLIPTTYILMSPMDVSVRLSELIAHRHVDTATLRQCSTIEPFVRNVGTVTYQKATPAWKYRRNDNGALVKSARGDLGSFVRWFELSTRSKMEKSLAPFTDAWDEDFGSLYIYNLMHVDFQAFLGLEYDANLDVTYQHQMADLQELADFEGWD